MIKQIRNQKGSVQLFTIVLAVAVVISLALFLYFQGKTGTQQQAFQNVPVINSPSDLGTIANDLDNVDMNQFDSDLKQLDIDASDF